MKVMLVALAVLALAASAASTSYMPPPRPQCSCQPHPPTAPPPQPCPCQQPVGGCGVGGGVPPPTPILEHCVEFLRQQCSPTTPTPQCSPQCQMHRQQCCQQLRQMEPLHRFQTIYGMVLQAIMQQQPQGHVGAPVVAVQIAQQMLEMCGLHLQPPSPCPCAGGV